MPNIVVRVARYLLRNRKRSALLQNATGTTTQQSAEITNPETLSPKPSPKQPSPKKEHENTSNISAEPSGDNVTKCTKNEQNARNDDAKNSSSTVPNYMAINLSSKNTQSTTVRTRRVLRELQVMMKAASRPDCPFEVNLVDESNLFEWDIHLLRVDSTSDLWRSMQQTGTKSIHFRLTFPELFPFQPPFMRLIGPYLDNGFIMDGGAICMEVLTSQGWSSAYTVESLLIQVASGLTQGGAVISHKQKRKYNQLTQKRAEAEFRRICKIHAKYGWVNMERGEEA